MPQSRSQNHAPLLDQMQPNEQPHSQTQTSSQSSLTLAAQFQNPSSSDANADANADGVFAPPKKSNWSMHMYIFFKPDTAVYQKLAAMVARGVEWHKRRDHTCSEGLLNHGDGIHNGIYTHEETQIRPSPVSNPSLESKFKSGRKDIYAMPAFFNGTMYSARSDGFIYAVKIINSSVLWKKDLQKLTGLNATMHPGNGTATVSALTVACDLLIVGIYGPALVVALERATGKLVWSTLLDSHPAAVVTMSGTFHNRGFYPSKCLLIRHRKPILSSSHHTTVPPKPEQSNRPYSSGPVCGG
ncbi:hypothetical protein LOK49_LG01G03831 [Camellia lanceoleosa]|uniref:Uncharacterized protein n=1 Tax=Camellia lanceoleosa TaxID=1840588 RepID=A0ACC0J1R2_9ERIC|nr:hypothetical protein LOK49_LG01G03831 [Camellia lanceoleosa]